MNENCDIVKDLLPLYVEDLTSESSNQFIKEHLNSCEECMIYLKNIEKDIPSTKESILPDDYEDQELIKTIKKRISNQMFLTAVLGILIGLLISAIFFPWASVALIAFLIFIGIIIYLMY